MTGRCLNGEKMEKCGTWLKISPAGVYECSICKQLVMTSDIDEYKFCHGCGTRMNKEEQKEEQTEDYLKKDEILKKIRNDYDDYNLSEDWAKGVNFAINRILSVPAAKVKELVNGEWISDEDGDIYCSICGRSGVGESFCEHCGAKMDGVE